MARHHGIASDTYGKFLLDSGAIYKNFVDFDNLGTLIGATRGGAVFKRTPEYKDLKYEGIPGQVAGQKQLIGEKITLEVSIIAFDVANLSLAIPNVSTEDAFSQVYTKITGAEWDDLAVHTLTNIALIAQISGQDEPVALIIDNPICENDLSLGFKDKAEAVSKWVFSAFYTEAAGFATPPWRIYWPNPGLFAALGAPATVADNAGYSAIDMDWTAVLLPSEAFWRVIARGNGVFLAVDAQGLTSAYSADGAAWTAGGALPYDIGDNIVWVRAAYGAGVFVVTNRGNNPQPPNGKAAYSSDNGASWASADMTAALAFEALVYGDKFVALVPNSTVCNYSADGINWSAGTMPGATNWEDLAYGGNKYVAICRNSTVTAYSSNGITWNAGGALPSSTSWVAVAYGDGTFLAIAAASGGAVAKSTDGGLNWVSVGNMPIPSAATWGDMVYSKGLFVAIGSDGNVAYSSDDGATWQTTFIGSGSWQQIAA